MDPTATILNRLILRQEEPFSIYDIRETLGHPNVSDATIKNWMKNFEGHKLVVKGWDPRDLRCVAWTPAWAERRRQAKTKVRDIAEKLSEMNEQILLMRASLNEMLAKRDALAEEGWMLAAAAQPPQDAQVAMFTH